MPPVWSLDDLDPEGFDRLGVDVAIDVGFHDPDLDLVLEVLDRAAEGGRLAAAGRRHQVQEESPLLLQFFAQRVRVVVVEVQNVLFHFNRLKVVHAKILI